jgi:hypothetical protein
VVELAPALLQLPALFVPALAMVAREVDQYLFWLTGDLSHRGEPPVASPLAHAG